MKAKYDDGDEDDDDEGKRKEDGVTVGNGRHIGLQPGVQRMNSLLTDYKQVDCLTRTCRGATRLSDDWMGG